MLYISHRIERHYCFSAWSRGPKMEVRDSTTPSLLQTRLTTSTACEILFFRHSPPRVSFVVEGDGWETEGTVNGKESHLCDCAYPYRPVEGGIPESQSWMTDRAQKISQKVGWSPDGHPDDGSITNSQVEKRPPVRAREHEHPPRNAQKHTQCTTMRVHIRRKQKKSEEKTFWAPECLHTLLHSASVPTFMPSLPHEPLPCFRVLR